jgi:hypothetical protein
MGSTRDIMLHNSLQDNTGLIQDTPSPVRVSPILLETSASRRAYSLTGCSFG